MAEEEESECERIDGACGVVLDPEKGPTSTSALLAEIAARSITENLVDVVNTVTLRVKQNQSLPSVKFLLELASKAEAGKNVTPEEVESLAERLTRDLQELGELMVQ